MDDQQNYKKGMEHYNEQDYSNAVDFFKSSKLSSSKYMEFMCYFKLGNKILAYETLHIYHDLVADWPRSSQKEYALERVEKLRHMLKNIAGNQKIEVEDNQTATGLNVENTAPTPTTYKVNFGEETDNEETLDVIDKTIHEDKIDEFIKTGVEGLDKLFDKGIPKGSSVIIAGGAGSGKTILSLQILKNHAKSGKKCLYMSFEESEEHLKHHMEDFNWEPTKLISSGNLLIKRFNPFDITRSVDALLMKAKGELMIDIDPIIFPDGFKPDMIVVDSLTAIASAFTGKEENYRIYIEQLFRFFEKINATVFLITETKQMPTVFSQTGVEEFLADGVIVLYNIKSGNLRENAIEVLKLRGAKHLKQIVAMQITDKGIVVYPKQEVFSQSMMDK